MASTGIRGANAGTGQSQIKAATISDADIHASAAIALSKLAEAVIQADGGQAFTGDQPMGTHKITGMGEPTAAQDAATKAYVDSVAAGLSPKNAVVAATTAALSDAYTYANGTLGVGATLTKTTFGAFQAVDNVSLAVGDRLIVKDEAGANAPYNGIYTVTVVGDAGTAWVLTRATDDDQAAEMPGAYTLVEEGNVNATTGWVTSTPAPIVVGTTDITWIKFSESATITAGAGLVQNGNAFDVTAGDDSLLVNADELHVQLKDASLETVTGGLRVKLATNEGDVYIGFSGTKVATPVTLSGDVSSITGSGIVTLGSTIQRTANFIDREVPTGEIGSGNVTFTLANTPIAGSEHVYLNGMLQESGAGNDYTISTLTITYLTAPLAGDRLLVSYRK